MARRAFPPHPGQCPHLAALQPLAEWRVAPYLQDAPPLVLLVLREHVSRQEGVAVKADTVGPVGVIFELSPVVGAPGTHHLREEGGG